MMPVSPWFYTNLPQFGKNWNWDSDSLWFDRWEEVIDILPQFVEVRAIEKNPHTKKIVLTQNS